MSGQGLGASVRRRGRRRGRPDGRGRLRRDEGFILAIGALMIVVLLVFAGFATDLGAWYTTASHAQNASDAAALAGVVWLPDEAKAESAALEAARRNGFDDADPDVDVDVTFLDDQRMRVDIQAPAHQFFTQLVMDGFDITRAATAEYVLPVPLGSPKNHLGTGLMLPGTTSDEGMWLSINGACSSREQGDWRSPEYAHNWTSGGFICTASGTSVANPHHVNPDTYQAIVEVPPGVGTVRLLLYDAAKFGDPPCPNRTTSGGQVYCNGVLQGTYWANTYPGYPDRGATPVSTTYKLQAPDSTPFSWDDNGLASCSATGQSNPRAFNGWSANTDTSSFTPSINLLGNTRWTNFCDLTTPGKYLLSVYTRPAESGATGINNFAVFAQVGTSGGVCDTRTSSNCPGVYGKDFLSIYAAAASSSASLFCCEVPNEHEGKILEVTLFDPGEGGNYIQFLNPNNVPSSFDYRVYAPENLTTPLATGANVTSLNVSGTVTPPAGNLSNSRYNDKVVKVRIKLPTDFDAAYGVGGNRWWKVYYAFNGGVTDRTTWQVRILGDPVHLIPNS